MPSFKAQIRIVSLVMLLATTFVTNAENLLEGYGKLESTGKTWKIELSEKSPGLKVEMTDTLYGSDGLDGTSFTVDDWTNHPGAFAYVDETETIYLFNGLDKTLIMTPIMGGDKFELDNWQRTFPEEFIKRLPAKLTEQAKEKNKRYENLK